MPRNRLLKGLLGVSAVAALFAALAVQAQTTDPQSAATQSRGGTTAGQDSGGMAGQGQSQTQGATASGTGTATAALNRADRKMVLNMAMANMSEIEAGKMAQAKSQNEQVKNFAQQMIDDHTKAMTEVQQLAQAKGVTLPTELDRTHKAKANKLAGLSGDAFDRAYMAQAGVADHKKNHELLKQAQTRARDPDLKALAARLTPTVDQHLNSAQQLHSTHETARGSSKAGAEKSGQ